MIGFFMAVAAAPAAAATRVWDGGGGADNNWMTKENWQSNIAPVAGDSLEFSAAFLMPIATNNNFPNGTKFDSITFAGGSVTVNGNRILIGSAITHFGQFDAVINCDLTLEGGLSATGVTLNVSQPSGYLQLKGAIDSTGGVFQPALRKIGNGRVEVFGVNTYGNVTAIEVGEIRMHHASALGAATANTVVSGGAVLSVEIAGAPVVSEPLMLAGQGTENALDGALTFRPPTAWGGTIALFGASTPSIMLSYTGAFSTISGKISGGSGLIKQGPSWLRLSGDNTYTGMTYVMGSALVVGHAHALGSLSAGTNVGSGGSVRIDVADIINEPLLADTEGSGGVAIYCESQVALICTWNGSIDLFGLNASA